MLCLPSNAPAPTNLDLPFVRIFWNQKVAVWWKRVSCGDTGGGFKLMVLAKCLFSGEQQSKKAANKGEGKARVLTEAFTVYYIAGFLL